MIATNALPRKIDGRAMRSPEFMYLTSSKFTDVTSKNIQVAARNITRDCESEADIARKIFYWVRDHATYKLGIFSHTASETLENAFGSCTNKANLFVSLCRAAGVPAGFPRWDPSPVIPSDLSFGYLSAELKSPVKIPIPIDTPCVNLISAIRESIPPYRFPSPPRLPNSMLSSTPFPAPTPTTYGEKRLPAAYTRSMRDSKTLLGV